MQVPKEQLDQQARKVSEVKLDQPALQVRVLQVLQVRPDPRVKSVRPDPKVIRVYRATSENPVPQDLQDQQVSDRQVQPALRATRAT